MRHWHANYDVIVNILGVRYLENCRKRHVSDVAYLYLYP